MGIKLGKLALNLVTFISTAVMIALKHQHYLVPSVILKSPTKVAQSFYSNAKVLLKKKRSCKCVV